MSRTPRSSTGRTGPDPGRPRESTFLISPKTPYRLDWTVWALRRRPSNTTDRWEGQSYRRVLAVEGGLPIGVTVRQVGRPRSPRLRVELSGGPRTAATVRALRTMVERMLGVHADLSGFYRMARRNPDLGRLVDRFRGLKPPRFPSVFEALVNGISCQQLSLTVGIELLNRLCRACGPSIETPPERHYAFPAPDDLLTLDVDRLRGLGFSRRKAATLLGVARRASHNEIELEGLSEVGRSDAVQRLEALPGVGRWTAEYTVLRGIGAWELFPGDDVGARNALARHLGLRRARSYEGVRRATSAWAPYAGLVYFHLLLAGVVEGGAAAPKSGAPSALPRGRSPATADRPSGAGQDSLASTGPWDAERAGDRPIEP